jgi:hypothetical protein
VRWLDAAEGRLRRAAADGWTPTLGPAGQQGQRGADGARTGAVLPRRRLGARR